MIQRILLVFLLTLSFFELSAQEKRVHTLEFVPYFMDSTPDCVEKYHYNGRFLVDSFPVNKEVFKGFIQVHPLYRQQFNEISSQHEPIRISTLGYHFKQEGLKEEDAVQWLQIDRNMRDSIMKTDYSYLLNHLIYVDEAAIVDSVGKIIHPDSIPTGQILDGVYMRSMFIPKPFGYKEKLNFSYDTLPEKFTHLLEPFHLSQFEVSNFEYRKFIHYVKDSIMKHLCYENLAPSEAIKLLNCTKKELKSIDQKYKAENLKKYGFKEFIDFSSDSSIIAATKEMYYPQPERFYKRREIDVRKLIYKQLYGESINVYPDTVNFRSRHLMYNWHPAYDNYPVLGLTKKQMEAYCEWKQLQVNKELKSEGKNYQVEVRLPYSYEYEFALQQVSALKWNYVQDWPNDKYLTYERNEYYSFLNTVWRESTNTNQNTSPLFHYNERVHDIPYFYNLTDNASEMIADTLTSEFLTYYGLNSTESCENLCVAYGENYLTGVKSNSDFEYNELFYKTLLRIDQAHPAVGFRLVYKLIKNIE
jgi:formylglycine-generating enzyme required for sulfatase activity